MGGWRWALADMSASNFIAPVEPEPPAASDLIRGILWGILWLLWQCFRLPTLLLLVVLEPVVSFVLSAAALLGVLTAFSGSSSGRRTSLSYWCSASPLASSLRSCSTTRCCGCWAGDDMATAVREPVGD